MVKPTAMVSCRDAPPGQVARRRDTGLTLARALQNTALMRFRVALRTALAFAAASLGGCPAEDAEFGETDAAGGTATAGPSELGELARLAAALCDRQAACGCEQIGEPLDAAACGAKHYEGLLEVAAGAAEAEGHGFDASCLAELADCWEGLECGQTGEDIQLCAPSCAVHRMNLGVGDACSEPYGFGPAGFLSQCEPGLVCLGGHGYSVCDHPEPLEDGESCDPGAHRRCAADSYCASGECQPLVESGDACERATDCADDLFCDDGLCWPAGDEGSDCDENSECRSELSCHPVDAVCVEPAEIGEDCRFPDNGFVPCVEGAWCGEQHCEAPLDNGDACMFSDGCPEGSRCDGGVCATAAYEPVCGGVPDGYRSPAQD